MVMVCTAALVLVPVPAPGMQGPGTAQTPQERFKRGHSAHGEAFDTGPRERPWEMEGIGRVHFPVTTSNPEAQKWFDQGVALLHSFWFFEAERAFRWCLKLDPDCAMAYWGLARASNGERSVAFIREAAKRKDKLSERERMYIEAWEGDLVEQPRDPAEGAGSHDARRRRLKEQVERICLKYPDDLEAKAFLALENIGDDNRYGNDRVIEEILRRDPNHPGAHHYRIHTWDGKDGDRALASSAAYGRVAPGIGHAQHMPGHIYSGVGMWHEAAISMDTATRVEQAYMRRRLVFPFNTWNYAHNRNYLCYIQEQLGMAEAALRGARELVAAPLDPKYNDADEYGAHWQGTSALVRALVKFERWGEILDAKTFAWRDTPRDKMYRAHAETLAHLGLGDAGKALKGFAEHAALHAEMQKPENAWLAETFAVQSLELRAKLALARGDTLDGLGLLAEAARRQAKLFEEYDDPPTYPGVLYTALGRAYLASGSPALAVAAFEKSLEVVRNDAFALAGLVEAHAALADKGKAQVALGRLLHVWSGADPNLAWLERAKAAGVTAEPLDQSPGPQRSYRAVPLDAYGPASWEAYAAPALDARDPEGKRVTLADYAGRNVLLIFYLGRECPHCLAQLKEVARRKADLARLDTDVLAISSDAPEENARLLKGGEVSARLLSDEGFENARRFKSYDDFEEIEIHSSILVDRRGRVHWARHGGEPFTDFDFLVKEIGRLNAAP
jgi:peroxiredoxin